MTTAEIRLYPNSVTETTVNTDQRISVADPGEDTRGPEVLGPLEDLCFEDLHGQASFLNGHFCKREVRWLLQSFGPWNEGAAKLWSSECFFILQKTVRQCYEGDRLLWWVRRNQESLLGQDTKVVPELLKRIRAAC